MADICDQIFDYLRLVAISICLQTMLGVQNKQSYFPISMSCLNIRICSLTAREPENQRAVVPNGRSRQSHKVSGTWSKCPKLNKNQQESDFHWTF